MNSFQVTLRLSNHSDKWGTRHYDIIRTMFASDRSDIWELCLRRGWNVRAVRPL